MNDNFVDFSKWSDILYLPFDCGIPFAQRCSFSARVTLFFIFPTRASGMCFVLRAFAPAFSDTSQGIRHRGGIKVKVRVEASANGFTSVTVMETYTDSPERGVQASNEQRVTVMNVDCIVLRSEH